MTETSRFWDGLVTGDATEAPYDAGTEFAAVMQSVSGAGANAPNLSGVFGGELNSLAVSGTVSPINVATGRALTYGTWYENDAIASVVIPTPAGATRIDYIVLRKSWAGQTIRITRIAGAEGGAAPALIQNAGVTWDQPLATVSITTGGAITVTDSRQMMFGFDVQVFTSTNTWTKPGWAQAGKSRTKAYLKGGGGGGASGRAGATAQDGGGAGGGGAYVEQEWDVGELNATETVTIGAPGTGGAGDAGAGNAGTPGGTTTFKDASAFGGGGAVAPNSGASTASLSGSGGTFVAVGQSSGSAPQPTIGGVTRTNGSNGVGSMAAYGNNSGTAPSQNGGNSEDGGAGGGAGANVVGASGGSSYRGGSGGGGGGGLDATPTVRNGGAAGKGRSYVEGSGVAGGVSPGGNGNPGATGIGLNDGGAGSGGASRTGAAGGNGGAGGNYGHGGGGGGASTTLGGNGGNGGPGLAVIVTTR